MHSILFVVKKPDVTEGEVSTLFGRVVLKLEGIIQANTCIRPLGEGALLVPLNEGLSCVRDVLSSIGDLEYTYSILSEELSWHAENKTDRDTACIDTL